MKNLFGEEINIKKPKVKASTVINKSKTINKSPSVKKSSTLITNIENAEDLAKNKLSYYEDKYICIRDKQTLYNYLNNDLENDIIAIDTETDGLDFYSNKVVGICLYIKGKNACYIPINHINLQNELIDNQLSIQDIKDLFIPILDKRKWLYHNSIFDIRMILHTFDIDLRNYIYWDTLNISHLIDENESHKLKDLHLKYCPNENETKSITFEDLFKNVNFGYINPDIAKLYAAGDAIKTYELYEWQLSWMQKEENKDIYNLTKTIQIPIIPCIIDMNEEGIQIDKPYLENLKIDYKRQLDNAIQNTYDAINEFKDEIENYKLARKVGYDKLSEPINLSSSTQLSILFYNIFKLKQITKNKTDADALEKMINTYPSYSNIFKCLLKYKELAKLVSAFVEGLDKNIKADGKIHPNFSPIGTVTGRLACKEPNLQQIPSHNKDIRKMFYAGDNRYIIGGDYSKQEVFIAVQECKDPILIKVFIEGKDIYAEIGSKVFNVSYEDCLEFKQDENGNRITYPQGKERRGIAKVIWLGVTYGLAAAGLADSVNGSKDPSKDKLMTKEEAQNLLDMIHTQFPVLSQWIKDTIATCKQKGYITNMYGRRRRLPDINLPKYEIKLLKDSQDNVIIPSCLEDDPLDWNLTENKTYNVDDIPINIKKDYLDRLSKCYSIKTRNDIIKEAKDKDKIGIQDNNGFIATAERQCVNSIIQSSAGCLIQSCMINIRNNKRLKELDFRLILSIHDEVLGTVPKENAKEASDILQKIMLDTAKEKITLIPIKVDPTCSDRWYGEEVNL